MFKNLFKRKIKETEVKHVVPLGVVVDKARLERYERDMTNAYEAMTIRFQDTMTGEITNVIYGDRDTFNKYMGNKNMRLIFS